MHYYYTIHLSLTLRMHIVFLALELVCTQAVYATVICIIYPPKGMQCSQWIQLLEVFVALIYYPNNPGGSSISARLPTHTHTDVHKYMFTVRQTYGHTEFVISLQHSTRNKDFKFFFRANPLPWLHITNNQYQGRTNKTKGGLCNSLDSCLFRTFG